MTQTSKLLYTNAPDLIPPLWALLRESGSVWLDSVFGFEDRGRYSYLARRPVVDLQRVGTQTLLIDRRKPNKLASTPTDWLTAAQNLWANRGLWSIGYISYEATLPFILDRDLPPANEIPDVRFAWYESVLEIDHITGTVRATNPDRDDYGDILCGRVGEAGVPPTEVIAAAGITTLPRRVYEAHVGAIKDHIREGDIYQANYTTRINVDSVADPLAVYARLRRINPAPYAAWLNYGEYQILSSSPERMFLRAGDAITTGPIKGTIARGHTEAEDVANLGRLLSSEKDRAELLMIVDLARNDLGKIAEIGSVRVNSLFRPERYASVYHLVGDVSARLRPKAGLPEILRALLPGGSITGAPKKRAVEIIREMEPVPRSVYTGCIGFVHGDRADFNIAIRTIVHRGGCYHIHAGGGVVADSTPSGEYAEMRLKAERMLSALGLHKETIRWPE